MPNSPGLREGKKPVQSSGSRKLPPSTHVQHVSTAALARLRKAEVDAQAVRETVERCRALSAERVAVVRPPQPPHGDADAASTAPVAGVEQGATPVQPSLDAAVAAYEREVQALCTAVGATAKTLHTPAGHAPLLRELAVLKEDLAGRDESIVLLQQQVVSLADLLEETSAAKTELEEEHDAQGADMADLREQLAACEAALAHCDGCAALRGDVTLAQNACAIQRAETAAAQDAQAALAEEHATLVAEHTAAAAAHADARAQWERDHAARQTEHDAVVASLCDAEAARDALAQEVAALRTQRATLEAEVSEAVAAQAALADVLEEVQTAVRGRYPAGSRGGSAAAADGVSAAPSSPRQAPLPHPVSPVLSANASTGALGLSGADWGAALSAVDHHLVEPRSMPSQAGDAASDDALSCPASFVLQERCDAQAKVLEACIAELQGMRRSDGSMECEAAERAVRAALRQAHLNTQLHATMQRKHAAEELARLRTEAEANEALRQAIKFSDARMQHLRAVHRTLSPMAAYDASPPCSPVVQLPQRAGSGTPPALRTLSPHHPPTPPVSPTDSSPLREPAGAREADTAAAAERGWGEQRPPPLSPAFDRIGGGAAPRVPALGSAPPPSMPDAAKGAAPGFELERTHNALCQAYAALSRSHEMLVEEHGALKVEAAAAAAAAAAASPRAREASSGDGEDTSQVRTMRSPGMLSGGTRRRSAVSAAGATEDDDDDIADGGSEMDGSVVSAVNVPHVIHALQAAQQQLEELRSAHTELTAAHDALKASTAAVSAAEQAALQKTHATLAANYAHVKIAADASAAELYGLRVAHEALLEECAQHAAEEEREGRHGASESADARPAGDDAGAALAQLQEDVDALRRACAALEEENAALRVGVGGAAQAAVPSEEYAAVKDMCATQERRNEQLQRTLEGVLRSEAALRETLRAREEAGAASLREMEALRRELGDAKAALMRAETLTPPQAAEEYVSRASSPLHVQAPADAAAPPAVAVTPAAPAQRDVDVNAALALPQPPPGCAGGEATAVCAECPSLKDALQRAEADAHELRAANTALDTALDELRGREERLRAAHTDLQAAHDALEKSHGEAQAHRHTLQVSYEELESTHAALVGATATLRMDHATLTRSLSDVHLVCDELRATALQLETANQRLQEANADMEGGYATLAAAAAAALPDGGCDAPGAAWPDTVWQVRACVEALLAGRAAMAARAVAAEDELQSVRAAVPALLPVAMPPPPAAPAAPPLVHLDDVAHKACADRDLEIDALRHQIAALKHGASCATVDAAARARRRQAEGVSIPNGGGGVSPVRSQPHAVSVGAWSGGVGVHAAVCPPPQAVGGGGDMGGGSGTAPRDAEMARLREQIERLVRDRDTLAVELARSRAEADVRAGVASLPEPQPGGRHWSPDANYAGQASPAVFSQQMSPQRGGSASLQLTSPPYDPTFVAPHDTYVSLPSSAGDARRLREVDRGDYEKQLPRQHGRRTGTASDSVDAAGSCTSSYLESELSRERVRRRELEEEVHRLRDELGATGNLKAEVKRLQRLLADSKRAVHGAPAADALSSVASHKITTTAAATTITAVTLTVVGADTGTDTLPGAGHGGPYAVVKIAGFSDRQTPTAHNTAAPVWNYTTTYTLQDARAEAALNPAQDTFVCEVAVIDKDVSGSEDDIGRALWHISPDLLRSSVAAAHEAHLMITTPDGAVKGTLHLKLRAHAQAATTTTATSTRPVVTVTAVAGRDLTPCRGQAFAVLEVDGIAAHTTPTVRGTISPEWDYDAVFDTAALTRYRPAKDTLCCNVTVRDQTHGGPDAADAVFIGRATVRLTPELLQRASAAGAAGQCMEVELRGADGGTAGPAGRLQLRVRATVAAGPVAMDDDSATAATAAAREVCAVLHDKLEQQEKLIVKLERENHRMAVRDAEHATAAAATRATSALSARAEAAEADALRWRDAFETLKRGNAVAQARGDAEGVWVLRQLKAFQDALDRAPVLDREELQAKTAYVVDLLAMIAK